MFVFFSLNTPKEFVAGISELSGMNTVMDPTYLTLFLVLSRCRRPFCMGDNSIGVLMGEDKNH